MATLKEIKNDVTIDCYWCGEHTAGLFIDADNPAKPQFAACDYKHAALVLIIPEKSHRNTVSK